MFCGVIQTAELYLPAAKADDVAGVGIQHGYERNRGR